MLVRALESLGSKTLEALETAFLALRLASCPFRRFHSPENGSPQVPGALWKGGVIFIVLTTGFLSAVTVFQIGLQLDRFLGHPGLAGQGFMAGIFLAVPALSSLMLALRAAPGLAADAVFLAAADAGEKPDPAAGLAPRCRAFLLMTPVLGLFALAAALAGGLASARMFDPNLRIFLDPGAVTPAWLFLALARFLAHGMAFPPAAAACGLVAARTRDPRSGALTAAARAFPAAAMAILLADGLLMAVVLPFLLP